MRPLTGAVPRAVPPWRVKVPEPAAAGATVAASKPVLYCAAVPDGETASAVVVGVATGACTVYATALAAELPNAGSVDVNAAVSEWLPTASELVVRVAVPLDTATGPPSAVPPSENWTLPAAAG